MKKRKLWNLLLMGFMFELTSCVQGDMFDILEEDLSSYNMVVRRKTKFDNYEDINWPEVQKAMTWINNHGVQSNENECYAYALFNYSAAKGASQSMPTIRKKLGPMVFYYNCYDWPIFYKSYVCQNLGLPTTPDQDDNIISQIVNASPKNPNIWAYAFISLENVDLPGNVIIAVNNNHWGVLKKVEKRDNTWYVLLKDQCGNSEPYTFSEIDAVYW